MPIWSLPGFKLRWIEHDSHDKWPRPALFLKSCQFSPDLDRSVFTNTGWCWDIVAQHGTIIPKKTPTIPKIEYVLNTDQTITNQLLKQSQIWFEELPNNCHSDVQIISKLSPGQAHSQGHKGRPCLTTGPLDLRGQLLAFCDFAHGFSTSPRRTSRRKVGRVWKWWENPTNNSFDKDDDKPSIFGVPYSQSSPRIFNQNDIIMGTIDEY